VTYESTATLKDLAERIQAAQSIVCTSHEKPDGDAMGSVLGLVRALEGSGKDVQAWMLGSIPPPIESLAPPTPLVRLTSASDIPDIDPDLIIVMDTGAWSQLETLADWLRERRDCVIGLDHHASGDDVAPVRYIDPTSASCSMIVLELLDVLEIPLNTSVAEALFSGLATDTGWFRQANADAAAFGAAARLLDQGVDKAGLYRVIEETARPARLRLHARALSSIQWHADGQVAIMQLSRSDFEETDGKRSDVTGLVNAPLVVQGAEMAVLLIEERQGGVKASMRSKPPAVQGGRFRDVRAVAQSIGGGGHVHAAGVKLDGTIDAAEAVILAAIAEA